MRAEQDQLRQRRDVSTQLCGVCAGGPVSLPVLAVRNPYVCVDLYLCQCVSLSVWVCIYASVLACLCGSVSMPVC